MSLGKLALILAAALLFLWTTIGALVVFLRPELFQVTEFGAATLLGKLLLEGETIRLYMAVAITVPILAASLYVVLSRRYADAEQKWAYAALGAITGFWLRG